MRIKRSRSSHALAALAAAVIALPPQLPVMAGPAMEKLFLLMKAKGTLTQEEYDMLVAASREEDKEREKTVAAAPSTPPAPAQKSAPAPKPAAPAPAVPAFEINQMAHNSAVMEKRLSQTENKVQNLENAISTTKGQVEELSKVTDYTSPSTLSAAELDGLLADKWYERIKLRGWLQFRNEAVMHDTGGLFVMNDPFANHQSSLGIRRARLIFSGDVSSRLYVNTEFEFFAGVASNYALQSRTFYADISLDPAREHRFRVGLSKIPFGFQTLQSDQTRLSLERAEAIDSAVENQSDMGVYYMWAPYHIRERFKDLVKMGLRGSGDYGVVAVGAYAGNNLNQPDNNGQTYWVGRVTYPFEFDNGQFLELSLQGYWGRYLPSTTGIAGVGTPTVANSHGVTDSRVAVSTILYPQPFGLESEWNWGRGPALSRDMRTITSDSLSGGYVQSSFRHVFANQRELIPFVRWQTYNGGRKFAANAPMDKVNEFGFGFRFIPYQEVELTAMYMHGTRTNTNVAPYNTTNYDYLGIQAQVNF